MSGESEKLWGGRFTGSIDPLMEIYNRTLPLGKLMYQEDLEGTRAHVSALNRAGILSEDDLALIVQGLRLIKNEWETETFVVKCKDEDIHTANERRLTEIIGKEVGGKVHTGRSRNDQVSTDLRLYVRKHLVNTRDVLVDLILALTTRARKEIDVIMPGYTHLQRAQPIRWAHLLSSYATQLRDDLERLELVLKLTNRCPLGCGAIAGNPYPIDREYMANLLGFSDVIGNSLAVVGDRDFVTDTLYWGTSVSLHLSRMAEDLILYSTAEFGFIVLHDAFSTGSSLMPQKKNPDSLELIRGKSGRVFGNLAGFLMTIKGIPSSYNKDLAEDKRPLFDTLSTVKNSLQIFSGVISSLSINENNMRKALSADMLATDLADYLVKKGVPFRESHNVIGEVVKAADALGRRGIDKLSYEELVSVDLRFQEDVHRVFDFEASVEKRAVKGGTAKIAVIEQLDFIESDLKLRS